MPGKVQRHLRRLVSAERMGKFLSVGVIGFAADMAVIALLVEVTGLAPWQAKPFSAEAAILLMFVLNERWTFTDLGEDGVWPLLRRLGTSNGVRLGGFLVAWAVLSLLVEYANFWYPLANACGIGVGFVVNYTFESLLTWQVHLD